MDAPRPSTELGRQPRAARRPCERTSRREPSWWLSPDGYTGSNGSPFSRLLEMSPAGARSTYPTGPLDSRGGPELIYSGVMCWSRCRWRRPVSGSTSALTGAYRRPATVQLGGLRLQKVLAPRVSSFSSTSCSRNRGYASGFRPPRSRSRRTGFESCSGRATLPGPFPQGKYRIRRDAGTRSHEALAG